jgi:hypothetical protein
MSYYQRPKFNVTDHCILRVKQRLKISGDVFDLRIKVAEMISNSYLEFKDSDNYSYYLYDAKQSTYFVVDTNSNIAITFTKISYDKKIKLLS